MKAYYPQQERVSRTLDPLPQKKETRSPALSIGVIQMTPEDVEQMTEKFGITEQHIKNELAMKSDAAHVIESGDFSQKQKEYQEFLMGISGSNKESIMKFHKSAGYEFEFASFSIPGIQVECGKDEEILPSHVLLSQSEPISAVFNNLPFYLYTDSSNALELVTPPFLFLKSSVPTGVLGQTFNKYAGITTAINTALSANMDKGKSMGELTQTFSTNDAGNGWRMETIAENVWAIKDIKHPNGVYGQANVSMQVDEIADVITELHKDREQKETSSKSSTSTGSEHIFDRILAIYSTPEILSDPELQRAVLLYSRLVSNLYGIPGILYRKMTGMRHGLNSATEIKEVLGVWIKAYPNKIILDYMKRMRDGGRFKTLIQATKDEILPIVTEGLAVFPKGFETQIGGILKRQVDFECRMELMRINAENGDQATKKGKRQALLTRQQNVNIEIASKEKAILDEFNGNIRKSVKKLIMQELEGLIHLIDQSDTKGTATEKFPEESFGTGTGVRKDTYLAPIETESGSVYIMEFRNEEALRVYEKSKGIVVSQPVQLPQNPTVDEESASSSESGEKFRDFDFGGKVDDDFNSEDFSD